MRPVRRLLAAAAIALASGLTACAAAPQPAVIVRVAPSADPAPLEVHLADVGGRFRATAEIRPGQTHRFTVPAGWVTVRVAGRCVVPASVHRTAVVHVGRTSCALD